MHDVLCLMCASDIHIYRHAADGGGGTDKTQNKREEEYIIREETNTSYRDIVQHYVEKN